MAVQELTGKQFFPFIAPPNGGKGTQTAALLKKYPNRLSKIDMGGLLRAAAADENNPLGQKIRDAQQAGQLVDIDIVIAVLQEGLEKTARENPGVEGFILDGFPRNIEQLNKLVEMCDKTGARLTKAVYLDVPEQVIIDRAAGRIFEKETHQPFNLRIPEMYPPEFDPEHPDSFELGDKYYKREDDNEETVRKRLEGFRKETEPMVDRLREMGRLVEVNGDRKPDDITRELLDELKPHLENRPDLSKVTGLLLALMLSVSVLMLGKWLAA